MKWESGGALNYRLIADDGEILERVEYRSGEYEVISTGKRYISSEQAKAAAARKHAAGVRVPVNPSADEPS